MLIYFLTNYNRKIIDINVEFEFEYFNSSSAKYIYHVLKELKEISDFKYINMNICWIYDPQDIDMLESGLNFQEMLSVPFKFKLSSKTIPSVN